VPLATRGTAPAFPAVEADWHEAARVLDGLLILGCVYVNLGADEQAREVLTVLRRAFEIGFDESEVARQAIGAWSPRLWLEISARAEILGAVSAESLREERARCCQRLFP
jgi:hypothetical protein